MNVELTFLISAVTALTGMILGILSARRNGRQDREKHSRETAMIISEIGYGRKTLCLAKQGYRLRGHKTK